MRYKLLPFLFCLIASLWGARASAAATDIYITATGSASGICTTGVQTPTFFNTAANWGSGGAQIGADTVVHLCGTFTGTANSSMLIAQGGGTVGHPVVIRFETGARLTAPYWGSQVNSAGAIVISGKHDIVVDGQNVGIIENTTNGSGLTYHEYTTGITMGSCTNCTVKNLTVQNVFVQVQGASLGFLIAGGGTTYMDQGKANAIDVGNAHNVLITGNTFHDCGWCISGNTSDTTSTNIEISFNEFYNFDHAWGGSATALLPSWIGSFHDNLVHDAANWDCLNSDGTTGHCHHDGIHLFTAGVNSTGAFPDVSIYNNKFSGNWGTTPTGFIFIEGGGVGSSNARVVNLHMYNNLCLVGGGIVNGGGWVQAYSASGFAELYNNTIIGANGGTDNTTGFNIGSVNNLIFKNNVTQGVGNPVQFGSFTGFDGNNVDHNFYGKMCNNGANCFVWSGSFKGNFANWKAACTGSAHTCDTNSVADQTALIDSNGHLIATSAAIGLGLNLQSLSISRLDNDYAGAARPLSAAWDAGAYNYASGYVAPPVFF